MSQLFASGGQNIGVSASTSDLPMNTQDWSPLEWTGWISFLSKELSRVFSSTTVQKHQFFCFFFSFLYSPTLTSIHDHWKNHSQRLWLIQFFAPEIRWTQIPWVGTPFLSPSAPSCHPFQMCIVRNYPKYHVGELLLVFVWFLVWLDPELAEALV